MKVKSNKEEFNKILQIIDENEYSDDNGFEKGFFKKFRLLRYLLYVFVYFLAFITLQSDRIIHVSLPMTTAVMWATTIILFIYYIERKKFQFEISRFIFFECRPEIGISRHLVLVRKMIHGQLGWSSIHYNIGCGLYRLGKIEQSAKILTLMQESCVTANEMMAAVHLKSLIAMYYKDYDLVMSCANEAQVLYKKARHVNSINTMYYDIQQSAAYAQCCKMGDFIQVYSVLQAPNRRPIDEVSRFYYLYCAANQLQDFENAEKYRNYVSLSAGTTWYGQAVSEGFVPESMPDCYPGFDASPERLSKPKVINSSRWIYIIAATVILILFYLVPRLISG